MSIETLAVEPEVIAALAARIAKVPPVHPATPFALLGLDSVGAIELIAAVEHEFGVELPSDVVVTCRDARTLASAVETARSRSPEESPEAGEIASMRADAVLPPDVRPAARRGSRGVGLKDAQTILLTGVTGFLGRWLARELIVESKATLVCLVRPGAQDSQVRTRDALRETGLSDDTIAARIRIVDGSLTEPGLGLTAKALDALAHEIDAVCHAGADVNWVLPYRALKTANVTGTLDLLRLACVRGVPFHFVSSLSVCYGAPLGYAHTKLVAEALVREAGRRGLPVTLYRPSLISGHSATGAFNDGDILARVVAGCVRMGTAPDLDWTMDCVPVDEVVRDIVRLSARRGLFALRHARPRHWRECALWMRLYGYNVRLVPYHAWLAQLERETGPSCDTAHPLRPLRGFFLARSAAAHGQTLPELMLRAAPDDESEASTTEYTPLEAALLERYFDALVARGGLPPVRPFESLRVAPSEVEGRQAQGTSQLQPHLDAAFFTRAIGTSVTRAEALGRLSEHSIIGELTSWTAGRQTGLFSYRLHIDGESQPRDVVVKIKARDRQAIAVGDALARLCGDDIGAAYAQFADRLGLIGSHERELAIYEQCDPRFLARVPGVLATVHDAATDTWLVILERITGAVLQDAVGDPRAWTTECVDCAVRGLASLHAIWYQRDAELRRKPWIGHVSSTADLRQMTELWTALARHAAPRFSAWSHPAIASIQRRLIAQIDDWRAPLDCAPRTLIHHDFNPRNVCIKRDALDGQLKLLAYDWELATIGVPQRDLAELLCFVLPPDASREHVDAWIERHRLLLEQETGQPIDPATWRQGFNASLNELMLTRLPMYALIHRVRPQSFLPRVVRTWHRLWTMS
jgi:thioester reductase-like protein